MTKRTRLFVAIASGILVVGLGTGLVAAYVGGFQNLAIIGNDGPDELAYVPADAGFVAYADVRDVMASELRQKLSLFQPGANAGAERFKEQTGINVETDIEHVVVSFSGKIDPDAGEPPLVLAKGQFNPVRIEGLVRDQGGIVEDYKGSRLLIHKEEKLAIVFLEPGLAAIGAPAAIRMAIDNKEAGSNVRKNDEVMRLVHAIDDGDAWVVARFDTVTGGKLPPEVASQLPPISWFSAKGFVDGGVQGQLRAETRDEAAAQNLQDVIRGFMALGRLQTGQHPEFAEFLNSVQLSGDGKTVSLSFSVPAEMIDALGALRAERFRRRSVPAPGPDAPPAL